MAIDNPNDDSDNNMFSSGMEFIKKQTISSYDAKK